MSKSCPISRSSNKACGSCSSAYLNYNPNTYKVNTSISVKILSMNYNLLQSTQVNRVAIRLQEEKKINRWTELLLQSSVLFARKNTVVRVLVTFHCQTYITSQIQQTFKKKQYLAQREGATGQLVEPLER